MIEFKLPEGAEREAARQRFAENVTSQDLADGSVMENQPASISASRLYAHAMALDPAPDGALEAALSSNLALRRTYREFQRVASMYQLADVIAASSEAIPVRRGVGCQISVEASQAEADQFIIVVELDGGADAPAPELLLLCDEADHCHRFPLPKAHRGVVQFIVQADNPIMTLLRDPRTQALLR